MTEEFLNILNEAFKKPCHTSPIMSLENHISKPIKVFCKSKIVTYSILTNKFEKISKELLLNHITTSNTLLPDKISEEAIKSGAIVKGGQTLIRLPLLQSSRIKNWIIYTDYQVNNPMWISENWRNLLVEAIKEPKESCVIYTIQKGLGHQLHKARMKCYS